MRVCVKEYVFVSVCENESNESTHLCVCVCTHLGLPQKLSMTE